MKFLLFVLFSFASVTGASAWADKKYTNLPGNYGLTQEGKVEIIEFFSYACGFCYELEPVINPWVKQLPKNVEFRRVPAMFGGIWNAHGQLYLTLETLGVSYSVHTAVFNDVRAGTSLKTPVEMAKFLEKHGVNSETFLSTYHSFLVQAKVKDALRKKNEFKLTGVPALVVNGKYKIDQRAGGASGMLRLADELVVREGALQ